MLLCNTEEERLELILVDETKNKYGYCPLALGRHSKLTIIFKCPICGLPYENTKKRLLDKKGICHSGECQDKMRRWARSTRKNTSEEAKTNRREGLKKTWADPQRREQILEKKKQTYIERYGTADISEIVQIMENLRESQKNRDWDSIIKKRKATNLERYQATNFLASEEGKAKIREFYQANYQVDWNTQTPEFREKFKKDSLERFKAKNFEKNLENLKQVPLVEDIDIVEQEDLYGQIEDLFKDNQISRCEKDSISYKPDFEIVNNQRKLFINIDGLYWHSDKIKTDSRYHQQMQQEFEKHNLTIFQFREHELRDKSNIVKSIVLNYLGIHEKKYHARKLTIKKLAYQETSQFFEENHLMGTTPSTGFGLYDDQELVSCLSVRWKSKEKKELEIARFASKINVAVRGGFSRLLKHVEREYNPNSIISFCDMRYSTGQSYEKNGFTNLKTTLGFEWTDGINAYNRLKCRANMDDRKLTQEQQAEEFGWSKIYDAGQRKYIKIL